MASVNGTTHSAGVGIIFQRPSVTLYDLEKRALDIVVALPLLILVAPIMLVAAIVIRLDSRGPVLYRRAVVGRGRRGFEAFKLRTMCDGAQDMHLKDQNAREELAENHKLRSDCRVTRVGKLLRKTSIDELPQLINVLLGQMSLVGPRMISFPEIEKFGLWQDRILSVKPGITGLWQVSGRSKLSYDDRVRLNVYYVKHKSIGLDLYILLRTIPAVMTGDGAY